VTFTVAVEAGFVALMVAFAEGFSAGVALTLAFAAGFSDGVALTDALAAGFSAGVTDALTLAFALGFCAGVTDALAAGCCATSANVCVTMLEVRAIAALIRFQRGSGC